jgi:hypothetical protein
LLKYKEIIRNKNKDMPLFNLKNSEKKSKKKVDLFEQKKKKEEEKDESKIVSGVFEKEEEEAAKKAGKEEKILGPLPELERKIVGAFDPTKRNLKIIRGVFVALFVFTILSFGFFYAELNPEFDLLANVRGPNTAQQLNNSERAVISIQTEINQQNYLLMSYYLRELSYLSDIYSTARMNDTQPQEMSDIQNRILLAYENAKTKYAEPVAVGGIPEETFISELRTTLRNELQQLRKETPTPVTVSQINDYQAALALVGNRRLNSLFSANVDNMQGDLPQDDTELYEMTQNTLEILNNEFSHINSIKQNRIPWAIVINEIENITKNVDTLYNTGFFEELGGIQYSAYNFDSSNNTLVLSGRVKRDDGTTFTLIANLLDALEKSEMFRNADNRSYPKSGSEEEGYISSFRIELTLEKEAIL